MKREEKKYLTMEDMRSITAIAIGAKKMCAKCVQNKHKSINKVCAHDEGK